MVFVGCRALAKKEQAVPLRANARHNVRQNLQEDCSHSSTGIRSTTAPATAWRQGPIAGLSYKAGSDLRIPRSPKIPEGS